MDDWFISVPCWRKDTRLQILGFQVSIFKVSGVGFQVSERKAKMLKPETSSCVDSLFPHYIICVIVSVFQR